MSESVESGDILDELKEWAGWLGSYQMRLHGGAASTEPLINRIGRVVAEIERLRAENAALEADLRALAARIERQRRD